MDIPVTTPVVSRRRFLRRSFAFSALAALGSFSGLAAPLASGSRADLLMIGDWGNDDDLVPQAEVAAAMRRYAREHQLRIEALLLLGDNWYGALEGGVHSPRWQTQFEQMYPADAFPCPAYAILGNHDYQRWPESKVETELGDGALRYRASGIEAFIDERERLSALRRRA